MLKGFKYYFLLMLIAFCGINVFSQNSKSDSLKKILVTAKEDTNKVKVMAALALEMEYSYPDSAINIYLQSLKLSEQLNWKRGIGMSLVRIGWAKLQLGNYPGSLDYTLKALRLAESNGDDKIIASATMMMGNIYYRQGDLKKALTFFEQALVIEEKAGDKAGMHPILTNAGNIYWQTGNNEKALEYYLRALTINKELGQTRSVAASLGNIAGVYYNQGNLDKALEYSLEAVKIYNQAHDVHGEAIALANIGSLYAETGKLAEAEKHILKAVEMVRKAGALNEQAAFEEALTEVYSKSGNWKKAFESYKRHIAVRDTIASEENIKKQTQIEMNYEFDKKEAVTKAEQEKKDAVTKIIIYSISGGMFLVLVLAGFVYRSYRQKQRANAIITLQKEEVEKQKHLVEEKQKEIIDSIHYAKRIQTSLLPTDKYIDRSIERLGKS
jgi:tetratricopeptide (TPR) repeat protein